MTAKRILLIDGHPDPDRARFVHALADRYAEGAEAAGHRVRRIDIAAMAPEPLITRHEWEKADPPSAVADAQSALVWAEHIVIFYPLWLGDMPALLKAFFEQVMRPGFAFRYRTKGFPEKALKGRSAHVVVTMGMPAFAYRLYYRAHSLKSLERNILKFVGIAPVRRTIIGNVEGDGDARKTWLQTMAKNGRSGR